MTISKVINNGFGAYKSSEIAVKPGWGVERVIFDTLVEENSATGLSAFRLGNRDPRFLFKNGVSVWITGTDQFSGVNNVTTNNATSVFLNSAPQAVALNTVLGELEIDFYGTDINLLIADGLIGGNDNMVIRPFTVPAGSTTETIHSSINLPTGSTSGTGPNQTISDRSTKANQVLPLNLGLTEGSYTLRLEFIINDASSTNSPNGQLPLFGCEIVNVRTSLSGNTTISDGQMFDDGYRYDLSSETGLPLIPSTYGSNTNGARVINYINSLDKAYEQAIEIIPSSSTVEYQATRDAAAAVTWTIPTGITSFNVRMIGSGGAGGNGRSNSNSSSAAEQNFGYAGAGGGSGSYYSADYTVSSGTTNRVRITVGAGGTAASGNGLTGGTGATTLVEASINSGSTFSNLVSITGGGGGEGGLASSNTVPADGGVASAVTVSTVTGFAASSSSSINGAVGSDGGIGGGFPSQQGTCQFAGGGNGADAANNTVDNLGGTGIGGGGGIVTSTTGNETAATAGTPFGSGGGGGAARNPSCGSELNEAGLGGQPARIIITFTGTSGLGNQGAGFVEVVDHSNEEVVRKVNWREFGIAGSAGSLDNGFADATSTGLAQYAFTLDDGTTTLAGNQISIQTEQGVSYPSAGGRTTSGNQSALRFTFVGTGLDILGAVSARAAGNFPYDIIVDGVNIGALSNPGTGFVNKVIPIISGLSYGTHVVTFQVQTGGTNFSHFGPTDFIIYGPKKPDGIPTGAVEIADYNIMADYVIKPVATGNASDNVDISQGTLGKTFSRELRYNGGWSDFTSSNIGNPKIFNTFTGTANAFMEYTFFGTGFELMARTDSTNFTSTISVDGALYTGAATPIKGSGSISTWTPGTSRWVQTGADFRSGISISGLSLGLHTIRLTFITGSQIHLQDISVITPIHFQNPSLKIGNTSIGDVRPDYADISPADGIEGTLGEAKAWVHYNGTAGEVLSSYNVAAVRHVGSPGGGTTTWAPFIYFDKPFKDRDYVAIATPSLRGGGGGGDSVITFGATSQANFATFSVVARLFSASTSVSGGIVVAFYGELIDE